MARLVIQLTVFALVAHLAFGQQLKPDPIVPPKKDDKDSADPREKGGTGAIAEEFEASPKIVRPRIPIDDEAAAVDVPTGAYYVRSDELGRAMADSRSPALRAIMAKYLVAFDLFTEVDSPPYRVLPIPIFRLDKFPQAYGLFVLDDNNQPTPLRRGELSKLKSVLHYEELIVQEAMTLMPERAVIEGVTWLDRVTTAERLLAAALNFHDAARDQSKRRGINWKQIRDKLVDTLMDVRLKRLTIAAKEKNWKLVRTLGARLVTLYPENQKLLEEVFNTRLTEAIITANESEQPSELEFAREVLVDFESRFPASKSDTAEKLRGILKAKAQQLAARAKDSLIRKDEKTAQQLLRTIESIDPNLNGLREMQGQISGGYAVLNVGVWQLPERMTPLTARFPSEHWATELLFESLVESVPDELQGVTYRPALATSMPIATGLARDFSLARPVEWAGLTGEFCDATDVAGTYQAIREDFSHTWLGQSANWFSNQTRVQDRNAIRIGFAKGHPFPLSLLTQKILPSRYLSAQNKKLNDIGFALKPSGTGPFRLVGPIAASNQGPARVVFAANPSFGRRAGRLGQPYIKEVHFVDISKSNDLPAMFRTEQLHVLADVPTSELAKFTNLSEARRGNSRGFSAVTASTNRQIWLLAFNHHKPETNDVNIRRAIAAMIDRDAILESIYRSGFKQFHKALSGPFPHDTWAVPKASVPLHNPNFARAKLAQFANRGAPFSLRLCYLADEVRSRGACELIRKQIEDETKAICKISINLEPLSAFDFHRAVYEDRNYDLAYLPFEYSDDWYPLTLGAWLDPDAKNPGGRNFMRYPPSNVALAREDAQFTQQLAEIRRYADFSGKLLPRTHDLHERFLEAMPFVPLWQLDRHLIVSNGLRIRFADDADVANVKSLPMERVFASVARWRMD